MTGEQENPNKRKAPTAGGNRKHDRKKFKQITNPRAKKTNITEGLCGILFSCTPHKENTAFREGVLLIHRHYEALTPSAKVPETLSNGKETNGALLSKNVKDTENEAENSNGAPPPLLKTEEDTAAEGKVEAEAEAVGEKEAEAEVKAQTEVKAEQSNEAPLAKEVESKEKESNEAALEKDNDKKSNGTSAPPTSNAPEDASKLSDGDKKDTVLDSLDSELNALRENDAAKRDDSGIFHRIDTNIPGAVFVQLPASSTHLISPIVEAALTEARQTKFPGVKHCMRMIPIYSTCYPKPDDVAAAVKKVAQQHFPPPKQPKINTTFGIIFRSRCNSGVHRDDFIHPAAEAIHQVDPEHYSVDLSNPDVTVLIEVLKTCCFIGVFGPYQQLAKLNLREAACPSPKIIPKQQQAPPPEAGTTSPTTTATTTKEQEERKPESNKTTTNDTEDKEAEEDEEKKEDGTTSTPPQKEADDKNKPEAANNATPTAATTEDNA